MHCPIHKRLNERAGIAIGPILFVVAILAILATAIAAGSSTFATNASQEANRTNAGALLQIGQTLKFAADRVVGMGVQPTSVTTTGAATSADIFSPSGGTLTFPSTALAEVPATDTWIYTWAPVAGIGTGAVDKVALLKVTQGVCDQINDLGAKITTNAAGFNPTGSGVSTTTMVAWDATADMSGKLAACIHTITTTAGYYFYQVLIAQ